MKSKAIPILLALFASLVVMPFANAFGDITSVEVNDVEVFPDGDIDLSNFAGDKIQVRVRFDATDTATDVRIKAWISGESENAAVTERFDVLANRTYSRVLLVDLPFDLNELLDESRQLEIAVESRGEGIASGVSIDFTVQRESYLIEILGVNMQPEVRIGEFLPVDVIVKNRGRHLAEDTFVKVKIPELGIENSAFYGDLSAVDQGGNVKERDDTIERRILLKIPQNAKTGLYTLRIEAFNSDSLVATERRILVSGGITQDTRVVSSSASKTFKVGETSEYRITLVNSGNTVRIFDLSVDAPSALSVDLSDDVVVVSPGTSRTVKLFVQASEEGSHDFKVDIKSDGTLIDSETFRATVEEDKTARGVTPNTAVLLTVILAIIFIVLLVVLIVLLTRKPEKSEEAGESYY